MSIDAEFLRRVQRAGWSIRAVDQGSAVVACPRQGCGLTVRLLPTSRIPETCSRNPDYRETVVQSPDDARLALRARREALALSIEDVESIAGAADGHFLKAEKDNPSRAIRLSTFLEWAEAIGLEVVLREKELPPLALRLIASTRHLLDLRRRIARRRAP